jgi:hypothetical protein
MTTELERLVNQLSPEQARRLLATLHSEEKKSKITFPKHVDSTVTFRRPQISITWKDALRHLNEVIIQDCDLSPVATIKAQVVDACATIAELCDSDAEKRTILARASRVVMETDYMKLLNHVANLATMQ